MMRWLAVGFLALFCTACTPQDTKPGDSEFLAGYGWTIAAEVSRQQVTLPGQFADEPGAYPVGFYWAYNNLLSKAVGLDFKPYAGQKVEAVIYRLNETLADDNPNKEMRAVLLHREGKLIGAYLDRMGHYGFAAALDRRTFAELAGMPLGQWLGAEGVVDWNHPAYRALADLDPPDLIRTYYALLDSRAYDRARQMHSLTQRVWYLFANRDPGALYNPGWDNTGGDVTNIRAALVKQIWPAPESDPAVRVTPEWNRVPVKREVWRAALDLRLAREITSRSGPHHVFIGVVQDAPEAPWLLDSWGTGP